MTWTGFTAIESLSGLFSRSPKKCLRCVITTRVACLYCCSGQVEEAVATARGKRWVALRDFRCVSEGRLRPAVLLHIYLVHPCEIATNFHETGGSSLRHIHTPTATAAGMERGVRDTCSSRLRGSFITTQKPNVAASFITMLRASDSFAAYHQHVHPIALISHQASHHIARFPAEFRLYAVQGPRTALPFPTRALMIRACHGL